jgi:hypothetical protein
MSNSANHNCPTVGAAVPVAFPRDTPAATGPIRHIYVHIPFCARICPYCAFYKDLLDRSQTARFCEAILRDLDKHAPLRQSARQFISAAARHGAYEFAVGFLLEAFTSDSTSRQKNAQSKRIRCFARKAAFAQAQSNRISPGFSLGMMDC